MIPFIKMHGCGNDYVFVDCFTSPIPEDPGALSIAVSDRHRSVGGDGLVLMLPEAHGGAAARMRMFNADGSEGSLCGNALRCMAMWLHQSGRCGHQFGIAMDNRVIPATIIESNETMRSAVVRVLIGQPVIQNPEVTGLSAFVREVSLTGLAIPELHRPVMHVSMGNPHTILFVRSLDSVDFFKLGPKIENHELFPNRTNVEFAELVETNSRSSGMARVRVWERGSGETQACGSGACAVAVAGLCSQVLPGSTPVVISMRGGNLRVFWDERDGVYLEGPAAESFRGVI